MNKHLEINVPKPCHESWGEMTPEAKGRFCGSCAKVVVDFSVMTDNEVLNYLNKNTGSTCGRFSNDQLNRSLVETQLQPNKTWRYWLASITSLFVMSKQSNAQSQANTKQLIGDTTIVTNDFKDIVVGKVAVKPNENKVVGRVVDEHDKPLQGASVIIKNTRTGVATDADGNFSLKVNKDKVTIVVSYIGYTSKEFEVVANGEIRPIKLAMSEVVTSGYYVVVKSANKRKSQTEKKPLIDTLAQCVSKVIDGKAFTVYPNPAIANGIINIAIKEAGNYEVQILDNQSKPLLVKTLNTQTSKQSIQLNLPSGVSQGINYVRLVNTLTRKQWVDKIVVQ